MGIKTITNFRWNIFLSNLDPVIGSGKQAETS
jgi:hypothetical protein